MLDSANRSPSVVHAFADMIVATIAGGLVLLIFYPLTVSVTAVKRLLRISPRFRNHRSDASGQPIHSRM
jgi:hypothetical protein